MTPEAIASELGKFVLKAVGSHLASHPRLKEAKHSDHEQAVATAVKDAIGWASSIQILGMARPRDPVKDGISLRHKTNQRRYVALNDDEVMSEDHLFTTNQNILLLGDPGSGKTTTLKRLTQRLILGELETNLSIIPLVIRFRDLATEESLTAAIARRLGLAVTRRQALEVEGDWNPAHTPKRPPSAEFWIGDIRAIEAIVGFFSENRALLILDGLDEYNGDRSLIHKEINQLVSSSEALRVLLTSRVGDYVGGLVGFSIFQICPLSSAEIRGLASLYISDSETFLTALSKAPYKDLADRPLFLMQLILIYGQFGEFPYQPVEIYPIVVDLVLRDWDLDQNVSRRSQYAGFTAQRKSKFLAALSYNLLIKRRNKTFTSRDLESVYATIHRKFALPSDEAQQVAKEIESHSGLIVSVALGRFEFCHLSLQEYLAADYLSRETRGTNIHSYLKDYPAVVAVSVALSSDPGDTLASLVLAGHFTDAGVIFAFLSRIVIEFPIFEASRILGAAFIELFAKSHHSASSDKVWQRAIDLPGARESVVLSLDDYVACGTGDSLVLKRAAIAQTLTLAPSPGSIPISRLALEELMTRSGGAPHAWSSRADA